MGAKPKKSANANNSMPSFVVFGVFIISLLALPVCFLLSWTSYMESSVLVFVAGVVICFITVPLAAYLLLVRNLPESKETFFYIFTIFAFTAVVDLWLALTIDGFVDTLNFYLREGEPYLKSGYGLFINYWDGVSHYAMYLLMTYYMLKNSEYRFTGLYWAGSILNSIVVFLPGNVIGKFGTHVKPSYLLNVPYALFPLIFGWKLLNKRQSFISGVISSNPNSKSTTKITSVWARPLDFFFIISLAAGIVYCVFRMLVALRSPVPIAQNWMSVEPYLADPTVYPTLQMIFYALYFVPFFIGAICALVDPTNHSWMPDWAAIIAGAAAQGQFAYMGPALHMPAPYPEPTWIPVPDAHFHLFLWPNLALALIPQLLALRCCWGNRPAQFYVTDAKQKSN